jgi:hypothetical protein
VQYALRPIPTSGLADLEVVSETGRAIEANSEKMLVDQESPNSACGLQPISYFISLNGQLVRAVQINNLIPGNMPYANPAYLQPNGTATPVTVRTEAGSTVSYQVYFQLNCIN